jgi:hypothetical protein
LTLEPQPGDDENIKQVRGGLEQMPRYAVGKNEKAFNLLLSLLDYEGEVASRASEAVGALATNPVLHQRVLQLD